MPITPSDQPLSAINFFFLSAGLIFSYFLPFFFFEFYYRYLRIEDIFCIIYLPIFEKVNKFFFSINFSWATFFLLWRYIPIFSLNYLIQRTIEYFQPWWIIPIFILTDLFWSNTWIITFSINLVHFWRFMITSAFQLQQAIK